MRRKLLGIAAALALTTVGMAIPASANAQLNPGGTLVYKTNLCLLDEANSTGYCLNLPGGDQRNGTVLQNWARSAQGEPNNDFHGWKQGTVTPNGGGWPWPSTLVEHGSGRTYDTLYDGDWVVMINFAPLDSDTNTCIADAVTSPNGTGLVEAWGCNGTALNQLWVSTGTGAYINVRGTEDTSNDGDIGYITLEGNYENGGTIGAEVGVESIYEDYHWYRRFGT